MASWLVRSTPDRAFRVGDLGGDIALCSWIPANLMLGLASHPGESRNIPSRFMLRKPG